MYNKAVALILVASLVFVLPVGAVAAKNCNTALSRIAKKELNKAIAKHRNSACSNLKAGPIKIDKTKALVLKSFQLCEEGPVVMASLSVFAKCGTSDAAFIKKNIESPISATAAANLKTCKVTSVAIQANNFFAKVGLILGDVQRNLKADAQKAIQPYCD